MHLKNPKPQHSTVLQLKPSTFIPCGNWPLNHAEVHLCWQAPAKAGMKKSWYAEKGHHPVLVSFGLVGEVFGSVECTQCIFRHGEKDIRTVSCPLGCHRLCEDVGAVEHLLLTAVVLVAVSHRCPTSKLHAWCISPFQRTDISPF